MAQVTTEASSQRKSLSTTVLRAMSLFGGLQVAQILCSAIRMKLVAWLIGPAGMGLFGIYNNMVEMIGQLSGLGMRTAAVRDVVDSKGERLAIIAAVIRRWGVGLGMIGAVLTLALAPALSQFYFGDSDHIVGIAMLASVLFLTSVLNSEQAIMQGTKHLSKLAISSLWGAVGGLIVSIPMFVVWRINSIAPSIIAYALITCVAALLCRVRTGEPPKSLTPRATFDEGKQFITLGFFMTIAVFVELLSNNIFLAYLNTTADTNMVGYYQSGYTLFNRYIGLVFAAIAMEYYPRLTQVRDSRYRSSLFVSHELSLVIWVLVPIIGIFITGAELIVRILYTA
ncbi:MAG: oligosaccharide flippase family protein, partial [Muribaculaceae bacterium]|nr:oligosaccharide flippase family protein [Muribaculaceae bacterium]